MAETFDLPGPVLEIGSYQVEGQEKLCELRGFFPDRPYVGVDVRPGPGVDCVADAQDLPYPDASVGTVVALNTLEHVPRFWQAVAEIHRVLRSDGVLLMSVPFYLQIHDYPSDYWRFTPKALEVLLEPFTAKVIGWHGPAKRPLNVWALALREQAPDVTRRQFDRYQELVRRYAHEPYPWGRRLRYRIGSWLLGRRPFRPYLEQEKWETVYVRSPRPERASRPGHVPQRRGGAVTQRGAAGLAASL
jgi:SAM-dependent methyltransferase